MKGANNSGVEWFYSPVKTCNIRHKSIFFDFIPLICFRIIMKTLKLTLWNNVRIPYKALHTEAAS